jgi:ABC-type multidrug transport system ATPase subunit
MMRNGADKTTTVRILGTLIAPSSGTAVVAGIPLEPANGVQIRRRISVMPEADVRIAMFAWIAGIPAIHRILITVRGWW